MNLPLQPSLSGRKSSRQKLAISIALLALLIACLFAAEAPPSSRILSNRGTGGDHYLTTVSRMITLAEQRIRVLQYVVRPADAADGGLVGSLLQQLVAARKRGVDVRVILDHSPRDGKYPGPDNSRAAAMLAAGGVDVRFDELDVRSHAKVVLVDHQAVVGSHNWTFSALTGNREVSVLVSDPRSLDEIEQIFAAITDEPMEQ